MPRTPPRPDVEWIGGMALLPAAITDEDASPHPAVLMWLNADGVILGSQVDHRDELLRTASAQLRATMKRPMWGKPHTPSHVRVASPELAAALRAGHPKLDVVCAPTPEFDEIMQALLEDFARESEAAQTYFSEGVDADALAAFFRAAAALYRAKPWTKVPGDQGAFFITIPELEIADAALMVLGQLGESFGLLLFQDADDLDAFCVAMEAIEDGEAPALPTYLALNYERAQDLAPTLRKEIATQHWEVAGTDAYPWLMVMQPDLLLRGAEAAELRTLEAIALALPIVLKDKRQLQNAWNADTPYERTLEVATYAGAIELTLSTEPLVMPDHERSPSDVIAALSMLDEEYDVEIDGESRRQLEEALLTPFYASPAGARFARKQWSRMVLDMAANYIGCTIASLTSLDLEEVVFETLPRKASIHASVATQLVSELRAVYEYLGRETQLAQAPACLELLRGPRAEARLEAALSDPSNFGMAKSLVMGGYVPGASNTPQLSLFGETPPRVVVANPQAKKSKRKAARKARKKSR